MRISKEQKDLLKAIRLGQTSKIKKMLETDDVDPNFQDSSGSTPLHEAIKIQSLPIIKLLIDAAADVNYISKDGKTPLDLAEEHNSQPIINYLIRMGAAYADELSSINDEWDDRWDDAAWKGTASSQKQRSDPPVKKKTAVKTFDDAAKKDSLPKEDPRFSRENLGKTFEAAQWVGRIKEMQELWLKVPSYLKKGFDFPAALAEARQKTLKRHAPDKPTLRPPAPPA